MPGCAGLRRRGQANFGEDLPFQFENLLFRGKNFALILLELGRSETFGVHQRLLALVIGRSELQIGFRDLDVVAEDVIEADLERLDAGAGAFARFDLGDVLPPVAG